MREFFHPIRDISEVFVPDETLAECEDDVLQRVVRIGRFSITTMCSVAFATSRMAWRTFTQDSIRVQSNDVFYQAAGKIMEVSINSGLALAPASIAALGTVGALVSRDIKNRAKVETLHRAQDFRDGL